MIKNKSILLCNLIVICLVLATACAPAQQKPMTPQTPAPQRTDIERPNADALPTEPSEANMMAKKLADKCTEVEGVNEATVILTGNTAICGLDVKADVKGDEIDKVKQKCTDTIKKYDSKIQNVSITTDADTITRIRDIADGVAKGKPVASFTDQLGDIMRRITPSVK